MIRKQRFVDIGANLTDSMYRGIYNGKQVHIPDLSSVLNRASHSGLLKIIVTAGSLEDSMEALQIAQDYSNDKLILYSTVGCHPTRASQFGNQSSSNDAELDYLNGLLKIARSDIGASKVVAVGECGLDFDRLSFCDKNQQKRAFECQFRLAKELQLPMFFHNRNTGGDFYAMVKEYRRYFSTGVVHSFTGGWEEAKLLIELGLFIGINGCSLKSLHTLDAIKQLPSDRIMLETDAPWCELRPSFAGYEYSTQSNRIARVSKEKHSMNAMVKSRNEPCNIVDISTAVAKIRSENCFDTFVEQVFSNTLAVFFPGEKANFKESS